MRRGRVLLAAAATLLGLALAEALLAGPLRPHLHDARDAGWRSRTRTLHTTLYQPDPELVYVPRPGATVDMDYGVARFDARGLRGGGVGPRDARARVVVVGDSLVWGSLLAEPDTLPVRLGEALGPDHEVLNLGVSGYDTTQERGWYRRAGTPLGADVVLVVYCLNDALVQSGPWEIHGDAAALGRLAEERAWLEATAPVRNETVQRLWWAERGGDGPQLAAAARHLARWHRLFTLPGGYVDDYLLAAADPVRTARTDRALRGLAADIQADGAVPVLLISPALYWWHRYPFGALHAHVRAVGEDAGFHVLDPLETWRGTDPTPFRFLGDNLHYTPEGTRRLAAFIRQGWPAAARAAGSSRAAPRTPPPAGR